jgi:hypothetical protein
MAHCIYCNREDDLSESDIIPDALTNAKIINRNVCRIEHNSRFSDAFESKVIHALALITNKLDIKSSKAKNYLPYEAIFDFDGTTITKQITSDWNIIDNSISRSKDGKTLYGPIAEIEEIAMSQGHPERVSIIDVNNTEATKSVRFTLDVYFSAEMHRLISKIAFEWFCQMNSFDEQMPDFANIIEFITTGNGTDPVEIVKQNSVYNCITECCEDGSHTLLTYIDCRDNQLYAVISLFGIAIYRVQLCSQVDSAWNNCLFQEVTVDGKKDAISYNNFSELCADTQDSFMPCQIGERTIKIQKDCADYSTKTKFIAHRIIALICNAIQQEPETKIQPILLERICNILDSSLIHKRSLKRYVKEIYGDFTKPVQINMNGTNTNQIFKLFILFLIGKIGIKQMDNRFLRCLVEQEFGDSEPAITVNDELCSRLFNKMKNTDNFEQLIEKGARVIASCS